MVHKKGVDLNMAKAKAIQAEEPPTMCKQLESFMGRISNIWRFIPTLDELLELLHKLQKNVPFQWGEGIWKPFKESRTFLPDFWPGFHL